ncbi:lysine-specific demethylase JMJ705-like [Phalaenopsis equestris]|uniref:lysine-specific demethylase JMJ705-like n=1 Tax=Phalaenopsis equestris TaxID=78828 RepID=UPI0009E5E180|nr:lysine-specific demethylase JMJ705-like [Phalaenopsis equestris]
MGVEPPLVEILPWLKSLPVAPEYHPTLSEFQDPIAYILKIEKEASAYGICKIVPPLPAAPRKTVFANLNKSFAARPQNPNSSPSTNPSSNSNSKRSPTFSTRQQQIGFCPRRPRPVQKPVWQSGDCYTLSQFEAKAKLFELSYLSKSAPASATAASAAATSSGSSSRKKKKIKLKKRQKKSSKLFSSYLSALEVETLYWKACADKPFSVEYANDIPGSGFPPIGSPTGKRWREEEAASNVGETAWNMRGVSRAKGSLLRFMKEEIPGVTSPMLYVAMMFSWFAWHVEDHELHSLNYLHLGAGKTWYGVPRDAALAFEDVVRIHGYCGEVNPLMTFTLLGEKTTVMSPEVLIDAGIPCCRLVQNAGEFVVTFPGSYHCGFSHGFNCGEAANIATPGWLRVAKEAAIRRASTNYPPMVSHFQLLYALALSLCSRMPICGNNEPRSSRLKDKLQGEGELMVKKTFVQSVAETNELLSCLLEKGSSCIVLPQNTSDSPLSSNSLVRSKVKLKPRLSLGLCSREEALKASRALPCDDVMQERNTGMKHLSGFGSLKGNSVAVYHRKKHSAASNNKSVTTEAASSMLELQNLKEEKDSNLEGDGLLDQGLLSCVTCGILSFACVAVVEPREAASRYLTSSGCSSLFDQSFGSGEINDVALDTKLQRSDDCLGRKDGDVKDTLVEKMDHSTRYSTQDSVPIEVGSENSKQNGLSALDLLASAYGGESSDSDDERLPHEMPACTHENFANEFLLSYRLDNDRVATKHPDLWFGKVPFAEMEQELVGAKCQNAVAAENFCRTTSNDPNYLSQSADDRYLLKLDSRCYKPEHKKSLAPHSMKDSSCSSIWSLGGSINSSRMEFRSSYHNSGTQDVHETNMKMQVTTPCSDDFSLCIAPCYGSDLPSENSNGATQLISYHSDMKKAAVSAIQRSDKDSSRKHVFCLQHAMEVEKKLCSIGGVHIMLLCHPDYPKIEAEAKALAEELGINYAWNKIDFMEATEKDHERIQAALKDEESIPTNSDWAVKLGINLYYSASLSKSPLYSKQMPYNEVIYKSFSCNSPNSSMVKTKGSGKRQGRQKKIVVAGKWCGKVWMSNQVHPYLAQRKDAQDEESEEGPFAQGGMTNPSSINGSESNGSSANGSSLASKKSKKRKKRPMLKSNGKRRRFNQSNDILEVIEDDDKVSQTDKGRILRSKNRLKHKTDSEGGPSSRLRQRPMKSEDTKLVKPSFKKQNEKRAKGGQPPKSYDDEGEYTCDIEGCSLSFSTKQELSLHKRDICPVKGCGKKLFSHKYMMQHRKVHMDDRPLQCPWKGCKMTFKWAWARTEHIRVHTGDRPYICREPGCGQTFRFVSDFSRHKRKTNHSAKKFRRS